MTALPDSLPPPAAPAPLLVDAHEAARLCGVCRAHWLRMHSAGRVPMPVRLGRCVRWNVDELKRWSAAGCPGRDRWQAMTGLTKLRGSA